jgi:hypothetical protein
VLDQRRRARGAPAPIEVVLPDDPRVRDLVLVPHRLDHYDRLASASASSGTEPEPPALGDTATKQEPS